VIATLALVGSGEFLERMRGVDAQLLARIDGAALARVVIIPTTSVPDGPQVVARWIELGRDHFTGLGAAVDAAPIATRADADDPAIAAGIVAQMWSTFPVAGPVFCSQPSKAHARGLPCVPSTIRAGCWQAAAPVR
jgi:hypothetical protein